MILSCPSQLKNCRNWVLVYYYYFNFRSHDNDFEFGHEEALVEDAKHYFDRQNPSVSKIISDEKVDIQFDDEEGYMSPVVSNVETKYIVKIIDEKI